MHRRDDAQRHAYDEAYDYGIRDQQQRGFEARGDDLHHGLRIVDRIAQIARERRADPFKNARKQAGPPFTFHCGDFHLCGVVAQYDQRGIAGTILMSTKIISARSKRRYRREQPPDNIDHLSPPIEFRNSLCVAADAGTPCF